MARDEDFLSRWSRRKSEAKDPARAAPEREATPGAARQPAPGTTPEAGSPGKATLPPVEALTPESDFAPFMSPEVDGELRSKALKTLFSDPHFNAMDMLDVYVDDYSKPDPIPESWLAKLEQVSRLGDRAGRDREEAARLSAAKGHPEALPEETSAIPAEKPEKAEAKIPAAEGEPDAARNARNPTINVGDSPV